MAGDTGYKYKDVFTDLLIVDSMRGPHSTGMALVKRYNKEVVLCKEVGNPFNLIGTEAYKKALNLAASCIIGHNRFATVGEHSTANAHPFMFEHIVGAHNGTLDKSSLKYLDDFEYFGTDSEAIFHHLNDNGLRDTLDQITGAWALTWFDGRDNTINFLRNSKRPLFYCYSKDQCTLLWASEIEMLDFCLKRRNLDKFEDAFYSVDADTHYSWKIPDAVNGKFGAPTRVEMKAKFAAAPQAYGGPTSSTDYHYWMGGGSDDLLGEEWVMDPASKVYKKKAPAEPARVTPVKLLSTTTSTSNVIPTHVNVFKAQDNVHPIRKVSNHKPKVDTSKFRPPYKNHHGMTFGKKEFNRIVSHGCGFCGGCDSEWGEFIEVMGVDLDNRPLFLCEDCYNDDDIRETTEYMILEDAS